MVYLYQQGFHPIIPRATVAASRGSGTSSWNFDGSSTAGYYGRLNQRDTCLRPSVGRPSAWPGVTQARCVDYGGKWVRSVKLLLAPHEAGRGDRRRPIQCRQSSFRAAQAPLVCVNCEENGFVPSSCRWISHGPMGRRYQGRGSRPEWVRSAAHNCFCFRWISAKNGFVP